MGRTNIWQYQQDKKVWAWLVKGAVGLNKPEEPIKKAVVTLRYFFKDKRRRDPDNYSGKFLLDGLVKSKVLEDDSFYNIKLVLEANVDRDNPRTELIIEEVADA